MASASTVASTGEKAASTASIGPSPPPPPPHPHPPPPPPSPLPWTTFPCSQWCNEWTCEQCERDNPTQYCLGCGESVGCHRHRPPSLRPPAPASPPSPPPAILNTAPVLKTAVATDFAPPTPPLLSHPPASLQSPPPAASTPASEHPRSTSPNPAPVSTPAPSPHNLDVSPSVARGAPGVAEWLLAPSDVNLGGTALTHWQLAALCCGLILYVACVAIRRRAARPWGAVAQVEDLNVACDEEDDDTSICSSTAPCVKTVVGPRAKRGSRSSSRSRH